MKYHDHSIPFGSVIILCAGIQYVCEWIRLDMRHDSYHSGWLIVQLNPPSRLIEPGDVVEVPFGSITKQFTIEVCAVMKFPGAFDTELLTFGGADFVEAKRIYLEKVLDVKQGPPRTRITS